MRPRHASKRRSSSLRAVLTVIALGCLGSLTPALAAELLMFEEAGCVWCARWHAEVGPGYSKSSEGRIAPLRRLDIRAGAPPGTTLTTPVRATPTFVLVEHGREVGRITGYPGADFFWGLLDGLMKKLEPAEPVPITDRLREATASQSQVVRQAVPICWHTEHCDDAAR